MKFLPALAALVATASLASADIQQPPSSEWGPTRKLGRGLGNICYGITELPDSMMSVNYFEGNSAAFSYGIVRGLGRTLARLGYGLYDTLLFPFPTYKGTYAPPYRSNVQWIWSGYSEFPPELLFETRYPYVRDDQQDP
ncbi:MAG: exosortase system-associated protein, TIGR04073 family [Chthoniobacterales bacterium]|nr:exosortase system-associated protein, TIGR04073 family [Chthoniobacterales bacterium]